MPSEVSRGWCGTVNNPIGRLDWYLNKLFVDGDIVYGVGQMEMSLTGTPHWQIYVVTKSNPRNKNGFTLKWVKENVHATAHWEKRRGTHEEARDYCRKEDTRHVDLNSGPFEFGEWDDTGSATGRRAGGAAHASKIMAIKTAIDGGAEDAELWQQDMSSMLRYSNGFDRYRLATGDRKREHLTQGIWIWGPPRTGKSHEARSMAETLASGGAIYYKDNSTWWDGYCGQKVVVWEEFSASAAKISYMLKLLDKFPMLIEKKGSVVHFNAEVIIFTSNEHCRDTYGKMPESTIPLEVLNAWHSRFQDDRGTIIEKKEVYVPPVAQKSFHERLQDKLDEAEARRLGEWESENAEDAQGVQDIVDLTGSDDGDVGGRDFYGDDEERVADGWLEEFDNEAAEWASDEEIDDDGFDDAEPQFHPTPPSPLRATSDVSPAKRVVKRTLSFHREVEPEGYCPECVYCDCFYGDMPCDVVGKFKKIGTGAVQSRLVVKTKVNDDDDE